MIKTKQELKGKVIYMKKILYVSDYTLDRYNSVRDILYNLITLEDMECYEHVIVKANGKMHNPINKQYCMNYKTYSAGISKKSGYLKCKDFNFIEKIKFLFYKMLFCLFSAIKLDNKFKKYDNFAYIKLLIKKEKPDLVVFLTYSPSYICAEYCVKHKIPYISILYDTYIGRPKVNKETAFKAEKYVIDNSQGYFVPDFFCDLYFKTYQSDRIFSFNLPLLIPQKDVISAYENSAQKYDFTYFGQIQSFRNGDTVKNLLKEIDLKVDVFSTEKYESDETFIIHPAVTKDDLYKVVAGSKFLVAIDNSFPYQDYLPSKAYLYVSFTKPIIAFGDNEKSALREFFKDYPYFYYQNISDSTDGLLKFLKKDFSEALNVDYYGKYTQYLPENAFVPLIKLINNTLDN